MFSFYLFVFRKLNPVKIWLMIAPPIYKFKLKIKLHHFLQWIFYYKFCLHHDFSCICFDLQDHLQGGHSATSRLEQRKGFFFHQNMTDFTFVGCHWIILYSDKLKVLKWESYKYMAAQLIFFSAVLVPPSNTVWRMKRYFLIVFVVAFILDP